MVNRKGWEGLLDAHWHIISLPGDLFHSEEIHSSNRAFFITVQGHNSDFRARTPAQLRWTDVLSDPPSTPPTSSINCDSMYSRCKLAHFCSVMSAGNYHHLVLVPPARVLVGLQQIGLLPVVVSDVRLVANYYALGPNQMYAAC